MVYLYDNHAAHCCRCMRGPGGGGLPLRIHALPTFRF